MHRRRLIGGIFAIVALVFGGYVLASSYFSIAFKNLWNGSQLVENQRIQSLLQSRLADSERLIATLERENLRLSEQLSAVASRAQGIFAPPSLGALATRSENRILNVFFSTNRKFEFNNYGITLSSEIGSSVFGIAPVRVPEAHRIGRVEVPFELSIFSFRLIGVRHDETRHFTVRPHEVSVLSREQWVGHVRRHEGRRVAVVYVHGFGNDFVDPLFRTAQLAYDLRLSSVPVMFSWPSSGGVLPTDYMRDKEVSISSKRAFLDLFEALIEEAGVEEVILLAHSMGSYLVVDALAEVGRSGRAWRVAELILAAPDLNRRMLEEAMPGLRTIVNGLTIYASSADKALKASRSLQSLDRVGDIDQGGPRPIQGADLIDATVVGEDIFGVGHSSFAASRTVLNDLDKLIQRVTYSGNSPRLRPDQRVVDIRPVPDAPGAEPLFWRIVR